MQVLTTFNFSNYSELLQKYRQFSQLESKFYKAVDSNKGSLEEERIMEEYMYNDLATSIYRTFCSIKPNLVVRRGADKGTIKTWDEVFGVPLEKMGKSERMLLCGLVQDNYIYLLPPEYYDPRLKFQNI